MHRIHLDDQSSPQTFRGRIIAIGFVIILAFSLLVVSKKVITNGALSLGIVSYASDPVSHESEFGFNTFSQDVSITLGNEAIKLTQDFIPLHDGQRVLLRETEDGFNLVDVYRLPTLVILFSLFVTIVILFGGMQGVRGLVSLGVSVFCIMYILLPGLGRGFDPLLFSLLISAIIVTLGAYITHGRSRTTTSSVLGMIISLGISGIIAFFALRGIALSETATEEALFLSSFAGGNFDVIGLVIGSTLITLIGVLYDSAISQAVVVEELLHVGRDSLTRQQVYKRALRVGQKHIGALVDTLAIMYVGSSLTLMLLFMTDSTETVSFILNREIISVEIVKILAGSIGLIISAPISTWIASRIIK